LEDVPPSSQDYVFTSHTLEHIKEWKGALSAFAAKSKPGDTFSFISHTLNAVFRGWTTR
jgi:hypothetical protein